MSTSFTCPDVRVPQDLIEKHKKKRKAEQDAVRDGAKRERDRSAAKGANSTAQKEKSAVLADIKKYQKCEQTRKGKMRQMSDLLGSVKEFSSQTKTGMHAKKHKEDVLTKLGVKPVAQQTMPFKMKMGIVAGRKKTVSRVAERAREGGVVTTKTKFRKK
jgi:hypothetical protein